MDPASAKEAREQGRKHYTGRPCISCGGALRYTSSRTCVVCTQKHSAKRRFESYGITEADFEAMRSRADFRCEICGQKQESLCIDHDHTTGVVRGLLCRPCNLGLGDFRDDVVRLQAAIEYLERFRDRRNLSH